MSEESRELAIKSAQELSVDDVIARLNRVRELMERAMIKGQDYGQVPGTHGKPTLLKPGAEKLLLMCRLDPQYEVLQHRDGDHLDVLATCILYSVNTGNRMGSGVGSCSTKESRYKYRWEGSGRERRRMLNADLADQHNTVLKIATKRSLVSAVLNVTGASQIFTQDMEDGGEDTASQRGGSGQGGRRAKGAGGAPPPALGPDDLSTVEQRSAFWRACKNHLGEHRAKLWMAEQLMGFEAADAKQLKCGQITALYERLQALAAASEPVAEPRAEDDQLSGTEEPDIEY